MTTCHCYSQPTHRDASKTVCSAHHTRCANKHPQLPATHRCWPSQPAGANQPSLCPRTPHSRKPCKHAVTQSKCYDDAPNQGRGPPQQELSAGAILAPTGPRHPPHSSAKMCGHPRTTERAAHPVKCVPANHLPYSKVMCMHALSCACYRARATRLSSCECLVRRIRTHPVAARGSGECCENVKSARARNTAGPAANCTCVLARAPRPDVR